MKNILRKVFTNFEKLMWEKKEGLYNFLMKLLSKSRENFRKILRKLRKHFANH